MRWAARNDIPETVHPLPYNSLRDYDCWIRMPINNHEIHEIENKFPVHCQVRIRFEDKTSITAK